MLESGDIRQMKAEEQAELETQIRLQFMNLVRHERELLTANYPENMTDIDEFIASINAMANTIADYNKRVPDDLAIMREFNEYINS